MISNFSAYRQAIWQTILLAIPVVIAQASQTGIMFVDTMMAGHVSATDLSGVALGSSIFWPVMLFSVGLLSVLTPIIAHLNGANQRNQIAAHTHQALLIASVLAALVMLLLYHGESVILLGRNPDNIDPAMLSIAKRFLHAVIWGVPAYLYFQVYRNQCEGLSDTKPAMAIGFIALLVNIPVNYVLIYGKLGFPALGGVGCGIASAMVFWVMFALIKLYTSQVNKQADIRHSTKGKWLQLPILKRIIRLGLPLALALFFEVSLFAVIAIMIAPLGAIDVAANQITTTISSMTFVLPLSLSVATSIRVGYLLGQQKLQQAKIAAHASLLFALMLAIIIASGIILSRDLLLAMFTDNLAVVTIGHTLLLLLAFYQCSDYLQITANSVLRGYKDTLSIFAATFIAYWVIGLPIGYNLALTDNLTSQPLGPAGFWIGIIIGLSCSAILLLSRMWYIQHQTPAQILLRAKR